MLYFLVLINLFFKFIESTEETDGLNEERSFYLYTTEKINKIKYFSPLDDEEHKILIPKEISLLSYEDINIGKKNIPDFMVSHIYKISYKMIPRVPTKILLFKNEDTPIVVIDIDQYNDMKFYKNCLSDNPESTNLKKMVSEKKRLVTVFNKYNIYVIEENSFIFDKLKINLVIFETLYNLKKMKKKMALFIKASEYKMNFWDKIYGTNSSENINLSNIYSCLISFDYFISSFFARVINELFELRDIDGYYIARLSENELMEILNKKISEISRLNSISIYCESLFKDTTEAVSILVDHGFPSKQVLNASILEIKKAYEVVKKIYSDFKMVEEVLKKNVLKIDYKTQCFRPISDILDYFLGLNDLLEIFIKTIKSNEDAKKQGKNNRSHQENLDSYEWLIKKYIDNIPSLNFGDYKNFAFIKGHTIETMIKDFKNIKILFNSLVDTLNKRSIEMLEFYEITTNFKNNVLNFKESVIRFKNIIDYIIFGINFRNNVFIKELISVSNENNKPGPSSAV